MSVTLPGGQEVAYTDHGGSGPVVVLLHSFLMDGRMFEPQLAAFDGFRCVTVDERGHGGTPASGPFDYWDVARDVLGVLDHLGVERAAVVGTSQGGFVALRMALLAPERVTALAVLGTSAAAEDPAVAAGYRAVLDAWVGGVRRRRCWTASRGSVSASSTPRTGGSAGRTSRRTGSRAP